MSNIFFKDPDETLDYRILWSARLASDTIASSAWTVPSGLTNEEDGNTTTTTTITLSGGTLAADYPITNRITTAGGLVMDQTLIIKIRSR